VTLAELLGVESTIERVAATQLGRMIASQAIASFFTPKSESIGDVDEN